MIFKHEGVDVWCLGEKSRFGNNPAEKQSYEKPGYLLLLVVS